MAELTTGVPPEAKHNLPHQMSGSRFPSNYAGTFVPGLGRLDGWGPTVPTDGDTGWAKSALFRHTDGSGGDDLLYQNNGSLTSCAFIEITSVAGADFGATGIKTDAIVESTGSAGVAISHVLTPTAGTAPAGGTTIVLARPGCVHTGGQKATATAEGFNATPVVTEIYYSELFIPCNMAVTGISVFNGSVASDDWHRALLDADGALVVGSATGAVTSSGTDVYQKVPFTGGVITLPGPATYYVAQICDGTVDRYNTHGEGGVVTTGVELGFSLNMVAGKITGQSFAAIPATNVLTLTFTTDLGPIASLY